MHAFSLRTDKREVLADITPQVRRLIAENGWKDGAVMVYCPHTTGAITVNEGADPDVARDIVAALSRLVPHAGDYRHAEGNSDAHVKSSLVGASELIPVADGELQLGTWQKLYFCEFDGPRTREVWVSFLHAGR